MKNEHQKEGWEGRGTRSRTQLAGPRCKGVWGQKGTWGDMTKNVRFAGGLNTWKEDTGNWGVRARGYDWGPL